MKIERKDQNNQTALLTLKVEKEDYLPVFEKELKKYRSKVEMKGFRKGKTPISAIKKMYGNAILSDVINDQVQKNVSDYILNEKIDILGSPIPAEGQNIMTIDVNNMEDFEYVFELGLVPEIYPKGVSTSDKYTAYEVQIPNDMVVEELEIRRKRAGTTIHPEGKIEENDILVIEAKELDGKNVKDKGWETGFSILLSRVEDEEVKKALLSGELGMEFDFDIYKLEKDATEAHVKKYLLNLDEDEEKEIGHNFRGKVAEISRLEPAELDQDFFDNAFGKDKVSTEEEAKEAIQEELRGFYEQQERSLTYREILDNIVETNELDIPADFLKRWLVITNEKVTNENVDEDFEGFRKNLTWTLIRSHLAKKYDINVDAADVKAKVINKIKGYMAQYQQPGMDMDYEGMADRMMQNREQVEKEYDELLAERVIEKIYDDVQLDKKKVSIDEFRDIVKEVNERINS